MTTFGDKLTISDVKDRFKRYYEENPTWGSLHIVLEDGNISDNNVNFCISVAKINKDIEGEKLAKLLLQMSKTQRLKLPSSLG